MVADKVEQILSRIRTLPTLPTIVYRLLKLVESATSTATDLGDVIAKDQALTARILKLVNSSFYALRCEVVKVSHAIALLGFVAIKNLALGLGVVDMFGRGNGGGELDGEAFWAHSLGCGTAARLLAERLGYVPAEEAFVAGLLHDIGKLVLHDHFRREQDMAMRAARESLAPLSQVERAYFKIDHAAIGERLAEHWRLPHKLRGALGAHHRFSPSDRLTNIVYLANALAKLKRIGASGNVALEPLDARVWGTIGIGERTLLRLMAALPEEVNNARIFLGINAPPPDERIGGRHGEGLPRRVLIVEEQAAPVSLVELVLLDNGHTTARTTDPLSQAVATADLVLLDYSAEHMAQGHAARAQIKSRTEGHAPVILLPAPRRVVDVIGAIETAASRLPV
jgi:putative nucleotidyltransferase with HDIG domain